MLEESSYDAEALGEVVEIASESDLLRVSNLPEEENK